MKIRTAFALALGRVMRSRHLGAIEDAGIDTRKVEIEYIKKTTGERITRVINPYETKPHRSTGALVVYAADDEGGSGQIKSFIANRIVKVSEPLGRFRPRWPVQFGAEDGEDE